MIGCSLPICPAEIVNVVRVPSASTPSMNCLPSDSTVGFGISLFASAVYNIVTPPETPGGGDGSGTAMVNAGIRGSDSDLAKNR